MTAHPTTSTSDNPGSENPSCPVLEYDVADSVLRGSIHDMLLGMTSSDTRAGTAS